MVTTRWRTAIRGSLPVGGYLVLYGVLLTFMHHLEGFALEEPLFILAVLGGV
jgi:hypothetical protein